MTPPTRTWEQRRALHDKSIQIVQSKFMDAGFIVVGWGVESERFEAIKILQFQTDPTALAARFKPDLLINRPGGESFLCEVKSEEKGYANFAVEVDSFTSALMHSRAGYTVCYAYVDQSTFPPIIKCSWLDDAYRPRNIKVPRRFNLDEIRTRLQPLYPYAFFDPVEKKDGSGTPFYLVPKNGFRLIEFDKFIQEIE